MADIPSDLFTNILSLLPVRSLLRFRSTSKSLRTLIDSHNFINLHLSNSLNFNLIIRYNYKFYQIDFPNLTTCVQLDSPFQSYRPSSPTLLGSCNGLLCILTYDHLITLWNPNTRKHWVIPNPPRSDSKFPKFLQQFYGFGFDPFTGDYKVVRISTFSSRYNYISIDTELKLFSSITNSWKLLPSMPYVLYKIRSIMGVFVDHSLHWVLERNFKDSPQLIVIAINLTLENFNEVPLPGIGEVANRGRFYIDIAVLGGCLSMVVNYQYTEFDVWVMKEYESRDSWCKLFTLMESSFSRPLKFLHLLGYSSDGKKVLFEVFGGKLCWYDLKSEQLSYVTGIPACYGAMMFVASLVQLSSSLLTNQHMSRCQSISKTRDDFLSQGFKLTLKKREGRTSNSVAESGCTSCLWFWK